MKQEIFKHEELEEFIKSLPDDFQFSSTPNLTRPHCGCLLAEFGKNLGYKEVSVGYSNIETLEVDLISNNAAKTELLVREFLRTFRVKSTKFITAKEVKNLIDK